MENATKAMLIAAGVLIGVMILSLGVALYSDLEAYVESSHERMRFNEQNSFNAQFTKYINYDGKKKKFDLTIQDVVTAANLAHENNIGYGIEDNEIRAERGNESSLYVAVYLNGGSIENNINDNDILKQLLEDGMENSYICAGSDVQFSKATGRVYKVYFWKE